MNKLAHNRVIEVVVTKVHRLKARPHRLAQCSCSLVAQMASADNQLPQLWPPCPHRKLTPVIVKFVVAEAKRLQGRPLAAKQDPDG